ncbi:InlB B-repeat-containing protein [Rhizobacter sp. P5_C2]
MSPTPISALSCVSKYLTLFALGAALAACGGKGDDAAAPSPEPQMSVLSINRVGQGSIASTPNGIDCGTDCSGSYAKDTEVTLHAAAAQGNQFAGWSGVGIDCAGTGDCSVMLDQSKSLVATFSAVNAAEYPLDVAIAGSGSVAGTAPFSCSSATDCGGTYTAGTVVTLTATPASGYTVGAWTVNGSTCSGSTCQVTMSTARNVSVSFTAVAVPTYALGVTVTGSGSVSSSPAGISCGSTCAHTYNQNTVVTLSATPASGYSFAGWSGAGCSGTNTCVVTMSAARTVAASFTAIPASSFALTTTVTGTGQGTLTSNPSGINCPTTCSSTLASGTSVTLTATRSNSSTTFSGWTGACASTGTVTASGGSCTVQVSAATQAGAVFTLDTYALAVTKVGSGTVASSGGNIACGSTCAASFSAGTAVTLTATPASGYTFTAWGGACTGSNSTCALTMNAAKSVSATFTATSTGGGGGGTSGKSWFVATTGSDSAAGTLAAPFKTLTKAVGVATAGDIIEVRAGTYSEAVVIRTAGTSTARITMRGYNGERPVLQRTGAGPTIYFYNSACDEDAIGSGTGNTDCFASWWTIQGLEVRGSTTGGDDGNVIKIDTAKVRIQGNTLCCSVADIVKLVRTANDVEVLDNEIYQSSSVVTPGTNAQGVDIVGANNTRVAGNYVHDVPDFGMYAKGNARNTVFENNLLYNIGRSDNGHAIMLGQETDTDRLVDGVYESYDGIVRNNVVVNATWACVATSSSSNVRIYNNSCYNTATAGQGSIFVSNESEIGTKGVNIEIYNNIIYGSAGRPLIKVNADALADFATLRIDGNIYWVTGGAPTFVLKDNSVSASLWALQYATASSGRTDTSRIVDPKYASTAVTGATSRPLTLSTGSPAINTGVATPLVTTDYIGTARPLNGKIDVGAYEY